MKVLNSFILFLLGLCAVCYWKGYGIRYNPSASLPYTFYLSIPLKHRIERGDIVDFQLGTGSNLLAKIVAGIPEDLIYITDNKVYVNENEIGEVLDFHQPITERIIPEGYYFMSGTHPESFDSRYAEFGLVSRNSIKERLWPIY
jgi:conjugal transfer pilin signal peptidase TrbI